MYAAKFIVENWWQDVRLVSVNVTFIVIFVLLTLLQLMILKKGLEVHRCKVPEALQPLHAHMEERYSEMKVLLEREYGIKVFD